MINFQTIALNKVPGTYVEIDNTRAAGGPQVRPYKVLLVGQKNIQGNVEDGKILMLASEAKTKSYFGENSILHEMYKVFRRNNTFTPVYGVSLAISSDKTAVKTLTITGRVTKSGPINIYISGRKISYQTTLGQEVGDTRGINNGLLKLIQNLYPQSRVVNDAIDIVSNVPGELGKVDIRLNYAPQDTTPEGLKIVLSDWRLGNGQPLGVDKLIGQMGDETFNFIAFPYGPSKTLEEELTTRFRGDNMRDGRMIHVAGNPLTMPSLKSQHLCLMSTAGSPTPPYVWTAALTGVIAREIAADPALPLTTVPINGVLPPEPQDLQSIEQREMSLQAGIATWKLDSGKIAIERLTTTYTKDPSYESFNSIETLSFLRWDLATRISARFSRYKLASDNVKPPAGQPIVTPSILKAEIINIFKDWLSRGLVEGLEQFVDGIVVERPSTDPNRLNVLMSPDLMNQLRIVGIKLQFLV